MVTDVWCTCNRDPSTLIGNAPRREKNSSINASYRANVIPNGRTTASARDTAICCARTNDVTAAIPSAASPQP